MILDNNINLIGIDENFLEELDELIEEYRVELFILNPKTATELEKAQELAKEYQRFKYTAPINLKSSIDTNCVALQVENVSDLSSVDKPIVIDSNDLGKDLIDALNSSDIQGVVLEANESDSELKNFIFSISKDSLATWSKVALTELDLNRLAIQSNYPSFDFDELYIMLKTISDLTFRAEQSIVAGGTRAVLKLYNLM